LWCVVQARLRTCLPDCGIADFLARDELGNPPSEDDRGPECRARSRVRAAKDRSQIVAACEESGNYRAVCVEHFAVRGARKSRAAREIRGPDGDGVVGSIA